MPLSTSSGGSLARSFDLAECDCASANLVVKRCWLSAHDDEDDANDADLMLIQLELLLPWTLISAQFSLLASSSSDDARKCIQPTTTTKNPNVFVKFVFKSFKPASWLGDLF